MLEARVEERLVRAAKAEGGLAEKWGFQSWPDRLLLMPRGRAGMLEVKRPGEEPTPLQYRRLETLERLGFVVGWADSFVGVDRFMERLCKS